MSRINRLGRSAAKATILGSTAVGGYRLLDTYLNDNLDDIPYYLKRFFASKPTERKKVVVLGTGWGATSMVKKLDARLYDVTVVSPRPFFFYTPLLCCSATGVVAPGAIIEPIRDVNRDVKYLNVSCESVDVQQKKVMCHGASDPNVKLSLDYDHLVVAVGAQPNTFGIKGVKENALFLKEIEHGRRARKELLNNIERAEVTLASGDIEETKRLLHVVVVGGGPTGVEFSGELTDFIECDLKEQYPNLAAYFKVTIIEALPCLLAMFKKEVQDHVKEHLTQQGVDVKLGFMLKEAEQDKVHIANKEGKKETIPYGMLLWVGGVCRRPFTENLCKQIGLDQTDRRGVVVDECLRVKGTPLGEVFAVGDCAFSGKPPTAQVAMQQGKYLGRMFRRGNESTISASDAEPFFFRDKGKMAYIGNASAVTEIQPANVLRLQRGKMSNYAYWKALYGEEDDVKITGFTGFAIWRYTYFSSMFGFRNQFNVLMDWSRSAMFGRPAASSAQGTVGYDLGNEAESLTHAKRYV